MVEDDPITQMLERIILSNARFCQETMSLDNGIAAVDWLETFLNQGNQNLNLPELIFLDLNMPMMDGWEFLKLFEEKYAPLFPNTKIIILSSTVNPLDWEKSIETLDKLKQSEVLKQFFVESYK
ncbi:MAG: response regulator [Sediminibacterium sp.]